MHDTQVRSGRKLAAGQFLTVLCLAGIVIVEEQMARMCARRRGLASVMLQSCHHPASGCPKEFHLAREENQMQLTGLIATSALWLPFR